MNRITTATLAKYIGSECEYGATYPNGILKGVNRESVYISHKFGSYDNVKLPSNSLCLILRPLDSMTGDDIRGLTMDKVTIEGALRAAKKHGIAGIFSWLRDHSEAFIIDYLRSRGIDCGGEIERTVTAMVLRGVALNRSTTEIVWVPSLIDAKVAKEAKQ